MRGSVLAVVASIALGASALTSLGCATYQDDLARGQKAFEQTQYERSLAILRALEPDVSSRLSPSEQARYAYLRGMTDLRIGYRLEARHWLSVAQAIEARTPNSLPSEWTAQLADKLKQLNEEVYSHGATALTNHGDAPPKERATSDDEEAPRPAKKAKSDDDDAPAQDAGASSKSR